MRRGRRARSLIQSTALVFTVMLGMIATPIGGQGTDDRCASEILPLIQQAGLDVDQSAPAFGCRQDATGVWRTPTVGSLADDPALATLDLRGQQLLAAVDRMSMDEAFASSMRYDRLRAVVMTWGPNGTITESDISDVSLLRHANWMNNYRDSYEASMMAYLARTMGDEGDLITYIEWYASRRDVTLSVITSNMNPMNSAAYLDVANYQRAPWLWQLADPFAIAAYTGQQLSGAADVGNEPLPGETVASLAMTPGTLRVAPGGSAVYVAQPILWGDWSGTAYTYRIEMRLPPGTSLDGEALCAPSGPVIPTASTCDVSIESGDDGFTSITMRSGVENGQNLALYVPVAFSDDLDPGTTVRVHAVMHVSGGGHGDFQIVYAEVVDDAAFATMLGAVISGRIEFAGSYSITGEACSPATGPWDLVLSEWGTSEVVARLASPQGYIGTATDPSGKEVCVVEFALGGLSGETRYNVARVSPGETIVCRACQLGTIAPSQQAQTVFTVD